MAKTARSRRRVSSRQFRSTPYSFPKSYSWVASEPGNLKRKLALERKDWEDATCSVCMDFPHNAVLLLCSSHEKGCRPYMCGTNYHHSNCLDQFKKAYTKVRSNQLDSIVDVADNPGLIVPGWSSSSKSESLELACPLCRGQVKGWTVVEPARKYLNNMMRNCMHDGCSHVGTYKELKKHVRSKHPCAKPREVDPALEEKWRVLEHERERQDVISTITSSMPRSVVFGDYIIEMTNSDVDSDDEAGDVEFGGGSGGISRSILYFFLQEGARLMRFQRDQDVNAELADEGAYDHDLLGSANISAASAAYSSGGDDSSATTVFSRGRDLGLLRSDRRRRRRRRRSRGSGAFD
ncbi:uncharacterized protein LOC110026312 [Phalaenopsis equestris]|uniref:uncharacterized protein LOC110026312 n=1 Tax=Phalaenopsis equestris TaxID=78828 RepID=UPI0009E54329|nr:uncharacterized protein LOC110026312 [Phalaenopsis equestris]XP_020582863.1 uncharacterized protein LOC110026312 [Phalaenopsis equestris]XP_020582864.1 uncharacterized protein LOC110026312 [Phalaenopsis equestris]XP_020582865.1 uncharacterized protein LOC110026312 [Phalaenopsis equestris]